MLIRNNKGNAKPYCLKSKHFDPQIRKTKIKTPVSLTDTGDFSGTSVLNGLEKNIKITGRNTHIPVSMVKGHPFGIILPP